MTENWLRCFAVRKILRKQNKIKLTLKEISANYDNKFGAKYSWTTQMSWLLWCSIFFISLSATWAYLLTCSLSARCTTSSVKCRVGKAIIDGFSKSFCFSTHSCISPTLLRICHMHILVPSFYQENMYKLIQLDFHFSLQTSTGCIHYHCWIMSRKGTKDRQRPVKNCKSANIKNC